MKYIYLTLAVLALSCKPKTDKDMWLNKPTELKYSKEVEKEVWGHVLNVSNHELYYGTALHELAVATSNKNIKQVKSALASLDKKDINISEEKFNSNICVLAMFHPNLNILKLLIESGADPNIQADFGYSAISMAAAIPDIKYLELIISKGGDVNNISNHSKSMYRSPLISAAGNSLAHVKLLIDSGADPLFIYRHNETTSESALHKALKRNKIDIVNYLIFQHGVDFTTIDRPSYKKGSDPVTILNSLRSMSFPLDSKEYKEKMKLVDYLRAKGLDYWSTKIPKNVYEYYKDDSVYLSKY